METSVDTKLYPTNDYADGFHNFMFKWPCIVIIVV